MDRSVYETSSGYGGFTEQSVNDSGFFKGPFRSSQPKHSHPYLWHRNDVRDPIVDTYQGPKRCRDAIGTSSLRNCLVDGYVQIPTSPSSNRPCPKLADLVSMVSNRLTRKVRESDIDLGVSLGEYRETAEFVSAAMWKTALSYRQLRRGDVSAAMQTLTGKRNDTWRDIPDVMANTWLAYSYGLRPLLKDVEGACKALERSSKPFIDVHEVRAFEGREFHVYADNIFNPTTRYDRRWLDGTVTVRGRVRFRVSNPVLHSLDQLGLTNPASVAWELVPFSFVVDWFLPVGDFLQSIVPPQGVDFVEGWISVQASGSLRTEFFQSSLSSPWLPPWHTTGTTREVYKQRIVLSGFPSYSFRSPDLSLSREQVASGISLLTQAAVGKPRPGWPI